MRFFTKKLLLQYLLILSLGFVGFGGFFVINENKLQRKIASERLHEYRDSTSRFFQQQWVLNALDVEFLPAAYSVEREAKRFSTPQTKCQQFFIKGELLGGFGDCKADKKVLDRLHEGWQRCSRGNLVLKDTFHQDDTLEVITVLNNPQGYTIDEQENAVIGINEKNIRYALPNLGFSLLVLSLLFFGWNSLIYFRKQRDKSLDRIHDFSKSSVDLKYLAFKLREITDLNENKALSHEIECVANLEQISLEDPTCKNGKVKSHNLKKLIDEFCTGFFFERNRDDLFECPVIDSKIYIKTNAAEFTTVLLNLFSNAFKSIHGVPHAKLRLDIISGAKEVQFLLSNNCTDQDLKMSITKRKGRGINIVKDILKNKLSLLQSQDGVLASFSAPIDWEATCPELH